MIVDLKRALDMAVAAVGLLLVAPGLALVALLIKLDSKGPVLFLQQRVGRNFQPFTIYKLRTMCAAAAAAGLPLTQAGDRRITRLGRFLRATKIDELPQLWNVLRGDMSLVGPRPEVPRYVDRFREDYAEILTVSPGMTDLASLTYRNEEELLRTAADAETFYVEHILPVKIRLGIQYVRRRSLPFDSMIILKTVFEAMWLKLMPYSLWFIRHRRPFVVIFHLALIAGAQYAAFWLRFDGNIPDREFVLCLTTLPWLLAVRAPIFAYYRLYSGLWRYTGLWDLQNVLAAVIFSELLFVAVVRFVLQAPSYPRVVFVLEALLLISLMVGTRLVSRAYAETGHLTPSRRVLILGAGNVADLVVRAMKSRMLGDFEAIGLVAPTSATVGQRIHDVAVVGSAEQLEALVKHLKPDELVLAVDQPAGEFSADRLRALGLRVSNGLDLVARSAVPIPIPAPAIDLASVPRH